MSIKVQINGKVQTGEVEKYIHEQLEEDGALHFTLFDPEYTDEDRIKEVIEAAEESGTDAYMVGGSLGVVRSQTVRLMGLLKENTDKPLIMFPGNVDGVSEAADAILFMSLLNSQNPYWLSGAQTLGAPIVKEFGVEPIPMAYIIMEPGGTVSFIGDAKPIPNDKPDIAAAYSLAGQYMGMRLVYLEAGSGADEPVPVKTVETVRDQIDVPLIVGGGIREPDQAYDRVEGGADVIVTGTLTEQEDSPGDDLREVIEAVKDAGEDRLD